MLENLVIRDNLELMVIKGKPAQLVRVESREWRDLRDNRVVQVFLEIRDLKEKKGLRENLEIKELQGCPGSLEMSERKDDLVETGFLGIQELTDPKVVPEKTEWWTLKEREEIRERQAARVRL